MVDSTQKLGYYNQPVCLCFTNIRRIISFYVYKLIRVCFLGNMGVQINRVYELLLEII